MVIMPLAVVAGVAAGLLLGGRLPGLCRLRFRGCALVWLSVGLQLALGVAPLRSLEAGQRFAVVVASYVLVGAWLVTNAVLQAGARRTALGLLALGWALNLAVMVPNGGMPVSATALERSGGEADLAVEEGHLWKHVAMESSTVLPWLADVVPVRAVRSAVSAGDFVMVAGMVALVAAAMVTTDRQQTLVVVASSRVPASGGRGGNHQAAPRPEARAKIRCRSPGRHRPAVDVVG